MHPDQIAPFSPPSMRFQPANAVLEGPSFSIPFKALGCSLVFGCAIWLLHLYSTGRLIIGPSMEGWLFVGGGLGLMFYTLIHILTARTRLTSEGIEQTWIWKKKLEIRELAYARLIRVKGFEWLVAPRFYTRSLTGKLAVFYVSSPALWAEFERLEIELEAFIRPK